MAVDEVETLFRSWITLATSSPPSTEIHSHLEQQIQILNNLLWTIGNRDDLPAFIAHQIIRTIILSDFGLQQPSREAWETSDTVFKLALRVHHLTILLALQSLALGQVVVKIQAEDEDDLPSGEGQVKTVLESQDDLFGINTLLLDVSTNGASLPVAVLCLGWAVVLNSLPPEKRFPTPGFRPMQEEFATRAFGVEGGFLVGLEEYLRGPLSEGGVTDDGSEDGFSREIARRKVIKGKHHTSNPK